MASAGAKRQQRARARRRNGVAVVRVEIPFDEVVHALLNSTRLTETEALRPADIERALAEVITDWAGRWEKIS